MVLKENYKYKFSESFGERIETHIIWESYLRIWDLLEYNNSCIHLFSIMTTALYKEYNNLNMQYNNLTTSY